MSLRYSSQDGSSGLVYAPQNAVTSTSGTGATLTGVGATATAQPLDDPISGQVLPDSVLANASAADITIGSDSQSVTLASVIANASIGFIQADGNQTGASTDLSGVSATASLGVFDVIGTRVTLEGVSASGAVGPLQVSTDTQAQAQPEAVSATASAGSLSVLDPSVTINLPSALANASAGSLETNSQTGAIESLVFGPFKIGGPVFGPIRR